MEIETLERQFGMIGARVKIAQPKGEDQSFLGFVARSRGREFSRPIRIDIGHDKRGEFFDILLPKEVEAEVVSKEKRDGHLLLLVRQNGEKARFLCGHDERHLFVAAIPERTPVSSVAQAKEALQPEEVARVIGRLKPKLRQRHRTSRYARQGEWFFI